MDVEEKKNNVMVANVHAFMKGQTNVYDEVPDELKDLLEVKEIPDHDLVPVIMPQVDAKSQKRMRQNIVLDQITKGYPRLASALGLKLNFSRLQSKMNELLGTFQLTADTITFRPAELPIVIYTLIVM